MESYIPTKNPKARAQTTKLQQEEHKGNTATCDDDHHHYFHQYNCDSGDDDDYVDNEGGTKKFLAKISASEKNYKYEVF